MFSKGETTPLPAVFADGKAMPTLLRDVVFKVENDQSVPKTERVATIEYKPASSMYVVRGQVQYRDVEGTAYLEMWNVMPDGKRYFTRTLAEAPSEPMVIKMGVDMQKISGTSEWREFALPFNLMGHKPESVTLEINIVMPGKGTIEVTGLTVSDYPTFGGGEWFDARTGITIGMILGFFIGCYICLIRILVGFLMPRGIGRRLITGMFVFGIVMGFAILGVTITALLCGQSFRVWCPFIVLGVFPLVVFPVAYLTIRQKYKQVELRKMQALDA